MPRAKDRCDADGDIHYKRPPLDCNSRYYMDTGKIDTNNRDLWSSGSCSFTSTSGAIDAFADLVAPPMVASLPTPVVNLAQLFRLKLVPNRL